MSEAVKVNLSVTALRRSDCALPRTFLQGIVLAIHSGGARTSKECNCTRKISFSLTFIPMKVFIKNMVCNRCVMVVREELNKLQLEPTEVVLGEAEIKDDLTTEEKEKLRQNLAALGFELLDDKKAKLVEKIKNAIIEIVHYGEDLDNRIKFSKQIEQKVGVDYHQLSTLFSETEGTTIEKYVILQRIEKVKELLVYNELTLSEIAFKTGYSSVQHLSTQFKKVTGLTPSHFKEIKENKRKPLDQV